MPSKARAARICPAVIIVSGASSGTQSVISDILSCDCDMSNIIFAPQQRPRGGATVSVRRSRAREPPQDRKKVACWRALKGLETMGIYFVYFANGLATSRAVLIKSCAIGLSVRSFRVTMPVGTGDVGRSTGKTLISEPLAKT